MFCSNCGTELRANTNFCHQCGTQRTNRPSQLNWRVPKKPLAWCIVVGILFLLLYRYTVPITADIHQVAAERESSPFIAFWKYYGRKLRFVGRLLTIHRTREFAKKYDIKDGLNLDEVSVSWHPVDWMQLTSDGYRSRYFNCEWTNERDMPLEFNQEKAIYTVVGRVSGFHADIATTVQLTGCQVDRGRLIIVSW